MGGGLLGVGEARRAVPDTDTPLQQRFHRPTRGGRGHTDPRGRESSAQLTVLLCCSLCGILSVPCCGVSAPLPQQTGGATCLNVPRGHFLAVGLPPDRGLDCPFTSLFQQMP